MAKLAAMFKYGWIVLVIALFSSACSGSRPKTLLAEKELVDTDLVMAYADKASRDSSQFSEQLVCRIHYEGGSSYLSVMVSNLPGANGAAEVKARVSLPDRRVLNRKIRKKKGKWRYGKERFQATVGDSTFDVGVDDAEIHIKTADFSVDLDFSVPLKPVRPAGGAASFGRSKFYVTDVIVPRARVTLEVTIPPKDPAADPEVIELEGIAYMVRRAGNVAPYKMAQRWFNLLDVDEERSIILSAFQRAEKFDGKVQGWLVYATDDGYTVYAPDVEIRPGRVVADDKTSYGVPNLLHLGAKDPELQGVIKVAKFLERNDDLKGLSKLERLVVERLMKPWTFRYDAEYLLKVSPDEEGGEPLDLRGTGRYTYQQLKKQ